MWAEPFDYVELKRLGFTLQEVRELEQSRMDAIRLHEREAAEAAHAAMLEKLDALMDMLRRALVDDDDSDE